MNDYDTINHGMFPAFVERWHSRTSYFHLLLGDMSITLDDVLSLLHLSIKGRLLYHSIIIRHDVLEMIVNYLGDNIEDPLKELKDTRRCKVVFALLEKMYVHHLWHWRSMVIMHKLCFIVHVHWGYNSCTWLAHLSLWTRIHVASMWFTSDTLLASSRFMSNTRKLFVWFTCTRS